MARFCTSCGKDIPDSIAFCTECGARAPTDSNAEAKQDNSTSLSPVCKKCGANLREGTAFCTECGAKSTEEVAPQKTDEVKTETPPPPPVKQVSPQARPQPHYTQPAQGQPVYHSQHTYTQPTYQQSVYHQPQPTYQQPPPVKANKSGGVVSTGAFFGTMLLFALPMIGFLACIIMCFAPKNQNLKNYAKANLIWAIIGFVFGILIIVGIIALGGSIMDYINQAASSGLGDMSGIQ